VDSREEMWDLKEVVFVEDVHSLPVGRVTKVGDLHNYTRTLRSFSSNGSNGTLYV